MIHHSVVEEGIIDVDEGTAINKRARRWTANILSNTQTVESFIKSRMLINPEVASPALIKMYDYCFDSSYPTQN